LPVLQRALNVAKSKNVKSWAHSRGAVDALLLSLRRIGWKATDAQHFTTDQNVVVPLRATSPELLAKMLRAAVQRSWQRKFALSLSRTGWEGQRVCGDPARILINSAWARQNPLEAHHAIKAFTGATWTAERALNAGYRVETTLCALCGAAEDTLLHRVCYCTAADVVCRRAKYRTAIAAMDVENVDTMFRTRGIMEHPAAAFDPPTGG